MSFTTYLDVKTPGWYYFPTGCEVPHGPYPTEDEAGEAMKKHFRNADDATRTTPPEVFNVPSALAPLSREDREAYFQRLGQQVERLMPRGASANGRALFFLLMVDADDAAPMPFPYVSNAFGPSFAPVLAGIAQRFASKNPDVMAGAELVPDALRKLSAACDTVAASVRRADDEWGGASSEQWDAARTYALRVLDMIEPEALPPGGVPGKQVPPRAEPEPALPHTDPMPNPDDPEPHRPHPSESSV